MSKASSVAFGGVMAALAVTILCLGTLIPGMGYVCPMLCMLILRMVAGRCGTSLAWAWYGAVSILGTLLCPDKEAAALFLFLGYYPIVKPKLDKCKLRILWKLLLFNAATFAMYAGLIFVLGMTELLEDFQGMTVATLILGNITFFLLDNLLGKKWKRR